MLDTSQEQNIFSRGFGLIGAIDEAGRGPLAGPVVAACVLVSAESLQRFKRENKLAGQIKDSKQLSQSARQELFQVIEEYFGPVGVGLCDHRTIDRINILEAAFLAMKKALGALRQKPDYLMVDGQFPIPSCSYRQQAVTKGDELVLSIAAASIIAKVSRDKLMLEAHQLYPGYGFDQHKGYGTRLHLERLRQYGPCPIHRRSFRPVQQLAKNKS